MLSRRSKRPSHLRYNQQGHLILMLLSWPWINEIFIAPSTLQQCLKYMGGDNKVHTFFANLKSFKGLEAYCIDAELYDDGFSKEGEDDSLQVHVLK